MIKIENLEKRYDKDFSLKIDNLTFPSNGIVLILGKSGCGKSTLLNILSNLDNDYKGRIYIDGTNIRNLEKEYGGLYRKKIIGYIHQNPLLIENMTVEENLRSSFDSENLKKEYKKYKKLLNIEHLMNSKVKNLSGGERQRIALTRVLLDEPNIILADEPTGSLDKNNSEIVMKVLEDYSKNHLVIIVTHDKTIFQNANYNYIKMDNGEIVETNLNIEENSELKRERKLKEVKKSKFKRSFVSYLVSNSKVRNAIFISFLSLALTMLACVSLIKSNIESSLNTMFSSYFSPDEILVSQKGLDPACRYRYDSPEESYLKEIVNLYPKEVSNYQYIYETDFLNLFQSLNDFRLVQTFSSTVIPGFDIRNFNEFISVECIKDLTYIDHTDLENDEIILSLNDKQIYDICFSLHILRDNDSLFSYVKEGKLNVSLNVRNEEIGYDTEVLFKVAGFINENENIIYHSNPLFNVELFEDEMQLESTLYEDGYKNPWTLKKSAVLNFFNEESLLNFLKKSYSDSFLNYFYFNNLSNKYFVKTYENTINFDINKLVVYLKNTDGFNLNILNNLSNSGYSNVRFSSYGGYLCLGNNIVNGFVNKCFISNKLSKLEEACDLFENNSGANFDLEDVNGVVQGGISTSSNSRLIMKFTNDKDLKISKNGSEILISKSLNDKLNNPNKLYFAYAENRINGVKFKHIDFDVLGYSDEMDDCIYVNSNFSILLFQYLLSMDYNDINVKGLVFDANQDLDINDQVNLLNNSYSEFEFSSPFEKLNDEMTKTLTRIQAILIFFSILSSIISILLIIILLRSIVNSNYREIGILYVYGFNIDECSNMFFDYLIRLCVVSFISSTFTGFLISILINVSIFGKGLSFAGIFANPSWILINFIATFICAVIGNLVLKNKIKKIKMADVISN